MYLLLLKKFVPAQDKNDSFLIIEALNEKHNSYGYRNNDETEPQLPPRAADINHFPL